MLDSRLLASCDQLGTDAAKISRLDATNLYAALDARITELKFKSRDHQSFDDGAADVVPLVL